MRIGRREEEYRAGRKGNQPACGKGHVVRVTRSGDVLGADEYLVELVQHNLYFSPKQERWLAHSVGYGTIIYVDD